MSDIDLIYAGIDEAGYGPLLGPLCVGCVVVRVADHDPGDGAPDLWERLDDIVCRTKSDPRGRIAIDDSKKLKGARSAKRHPMARIERAVLSAASAVGGSKVIADEASLLDFLGADDTASNLRPVDRDPRPLPVGGDAGTLAIDAARFARGCTAAGVEPILMQVDARSPESFNRDLKRTRNKASVNLECVMRHVHAARLAAAAAEPGSHPRIIVDRLGGRLRYREELARAFPGSSIVVVAEHPDLSRYRLTDDVGTMTISFMRESESRHLPVALASMAAKYVRELAMDRLNAFFAEHVDDLKPTAGYVQDGRRFLADVKPVIRSLALDRSALVRNA